MGKKFNWKKTGLQAFVGFCFTMLALSLFTFIIEPFINEKPNLEMICDQKIFNEGESVTFNITLENTGGATAKELFFFAIEESENEEPQYETEKIKPNLLQTGDVIYVEFDMTAPENQQPYWIIEVHITGNGYWKFELRYDYVPATKKYQIPEPN